jgi:hypothetical protein
LIRFITHHIHNHAATGEVAGKPGQVFVPDLCDPGVGQPHGIQHAAVELRHPGSWGPVSPFKADRLGNQPPQGFEVGDLGYFATIRRSAGGQENGILEVHTTNDCLK